MAHRGARVCFCATWPPYPPRLSIDARPSQRFELCNGECYDLPSVVDAEQNRIQFSPSAAARRLCRIWPSVAPNQRC